MFVHVHLIYIYERYVFFKSEKCINSLLYEEEINFSRLLGHVNRQHFKYSNARRHFNRARVKNS